VPTGTEWFIMSTSLDRPSVGVDDLEPEFTSDLHTTHHSYKLASCLINAQYLPAHSPAAVDNSLIGCTSHELTDDWSLLSAHFVDS